MRKFFKQAGKFYILPPTVATGVFTYCLYFEKRFFSVDNLTPQQEALRAIVLSTLFIATCAIVFIAVYFFIQSEKSTKRLLASWSSFFLCVNVLITLLIWPGYWVWDEYLLFDRLANYEAPQAQGIWTSIFYAISFLIYPSPISTLFIQILFTSIISGSIVTYVHVQNGKLSGFLTAASFLSPVALLNNQYVLRNTLYSYLVLVLCFFTVWAYRKWHGDANRKSNYLVLTFIGGVLGVSASWRSEGLPLMLIPVLFLVFKRQDIKYYIRPVLVILAAASVTVGATFSFSPENYRILNFINPLSTMLNETNIQAQEAENLKDLNSCLDIQVIAKAPNYFAPDSAGLGGIRPDFKQFESQCTIAFAKIVLGHPLEFLKNRAINFMSMNSLAGPPPHVTRGWAFVDPTGELKAAQEKFNSDFPETTPRNPEFRNSVIQKLLFLDSSGSQSAIMPAIFQSLFIPLILFTLVLRRRKITEPISISIAAIFWVQTAIVFMFAPANFNFYLFPVMLAIQTLCVFALTTPKRQTKINNSLGSNAN